MNTTVFSILAVRAEMKSALDLGDREFLDRLHRMGTGTVQEICAALNVTATAVRQRLNRLQSLDFVVRETVRSGRGRPHHAYRLTEAGRRELGENYAELARILWRSVRSITDPAVRTQVMGAVREALVQSYGAGVHAESLQGRFEELGRSLAARGFDVETNSSGSLPILRENNCPYLDLASEDPSICELEQLVFSEILGTSVTLTQCCLDGHHCCEFQPGKALPKPSLSALAAVTG